MFSTELISVGLSLLRRWGGAGLVALGVIDSSVIPLPAGIDVLTAVLAASQKNLWLYYALMSASGSVLGGYLTYRVAREGGKETLDQRIPRDKLAQVEKRFEKWGFETVLLAGIMPPPFPAVPFIAGAGALNYPVRKFLAALALSRALRFTIVAYLGSVYGRQVLQLLGRVHLSLPVLLRILGVLIVGGVAAYLFQRMRRRSTG